MANQQVYSLMLCYYYFERKTRRENVITIITACMLIYERLQISSLQEKIIKKLIFRLMLYKYKV